MEPEQYSNGIGDDPPQTGKEETPHAAPLTPDTESVSVVSLNMIVTGVAVALAGMAP
jgi:hypothetical protein